MIKRIITGICLLGVGALVITKGSYYLLAWLLLVGLVLAYECIQMGMKQDVRSYPLLIYPVVALGISSTMIENTSSLWSSPMIQILSILMIIFFMFELNAKALFNIESAWSYSIRISALILCSLPYIYLLRHSENGLLYTALCFLVIWCTDIMALFGGRAFGKRPLSKLSPKKTIEGTLIGITSSMILIIILATYWNLPVIEWAFLSIIISIIAQIGDLHESRVKRFFKIKDSSQLLPGHGGFYDRADSTLFVFPLFYIISQIIL